MEQGNAQQKFGEITNRASNASHSSRNNCEISNVHNATVRIKQEQSQSNFLEELEQLMGPVCGAIVPSVSTSTPLVDRSGGSVVDFFRSNDCTEPSPIVEANEQPLASEPIAPRRLFQDSENSPATSARLPPTKQPSILDMFRPQQPSSSRSTIPLGSGNARKVSSSTGPNDKGTKRGKSCAKGPAPKKRRNNGNQAKAASTNPLEKRRAGRQQATNRMNDSGFEGDINDIDPTIDASWNESLNTLSPDSEYSELDEHEQDASSSRDAVPHFSIHLLPVDRLRSRFEDEKLSEHELIEQIMDEVNEDTKRRYKDSRSQFEERSRPQEDETASEIPLSDERFHFQISVYIQKVEQTVPLLWKLGITDKRTEINIIIFYHRAEEIYALTIGQTWQAIQRYSCYDFPCLISGRLTSAEGNVEETTKHIAGNVRTSKSTKKNATMLDQLKNVRQNVTKEVRVNSSLYSLQEFKSSHNQQRCKRKSRETNGIRLQMGLAYVRIKKRIDLKNLPEILDHFSKIYKRENTFTFPDGRVEKHIDEFPPIRIVQGEEAVEVENNFYELIQSFMHHQRTDLIRKFDFVDKYINEFCSAEEFKVVYNNGGDKNYEIAKFTYCPTALEVLKAIRANCCNELTKNDLTLQTFSYRLKSHVRVQYKVRGQSVDTERRVVDLLEGEMTIDDKDYWKTMGQWWYVREEYYYKIYKEFRDLLNKPGLYVSNEHLFKHWNRSEVTSVKDYLQLYDDQTNYFRPPSEEALEEMSSQQSTHNNVEDEDGIVESPDSNMANHNHYFDMMRVCKESDGSYAFWLFYIFDSFDSGIRDASTRVMKSVEMLLKDVPTESTKSLLEKFWEYHQAKSSTFVAMFHDFEMFRQPLVRGNKVSIVVAFATGEARRLEASVGPLSQYLRIEGDGRSATLDREKNLNLNFNLDNVREILQDIKEVNPQCLNEMCEELEIDPVTDSEEDTMDLLTAKVFNLIIVSKYCASNESVDADKPVTGKLLKIRDYTKFKLFNNDQVNKTMFETISKFYITGFPGFIHKLECFQIHENVAKEPRLNLNFVEIK